MAHFLDPRTYIVCLTYFGHFSRIQPERYPYTLLHRHIYGSRPQGRPRKKWIDIYTLYTYQCRENNNCSYRSSLAASKDVWYASIRLVSRTNRPFASETSASIYTPRHYYRTQNNLTHWYTSGNTLLCSVLSICNKDSAGLVHCSVRSCLISGKIMYLQCFIRFFFC